MVVLLPNGIDVCSQVILGVIIAATAAAAAGRKGAVPRENLSSLG
jgi:hypothetical protein